MTIKTDRRSLLAAIPAVAVVATVPAAAMTAATDRRAWEHAMARYLAAKQEADDYDANVFNPLWEREQAFEVAHGVNLREPDGAWVPGYFERRRALWASHGNDYVVPEHINDEHERLWEVASNLQWEVMALPAPDLAALHWKLATLWQDEDSGNVEQIALADAVRLLPEGR